MKLINYICLFVCFILINNNIDLINAQSSNLNCIFNGIDYSPLSYITYSTISQSYFKFYFTICNQNNYCSQSGVEGCQIDTRYNDYYVIGNLNNGIFSYQDGRTVLTYTSNNDPYVTRSININLIPSYTTQGVSVSTITESPVGVFNVDLTYFYQDVKYIGSHSSDNLNKGYMECQKTAEGSLLATTSYNKIECIISNEYDGNLNKHCFPHNTNTLCSVEFVTQIYTCESLYGDASIICRYPNIQCKIGNTYCAIQNNTKFIADGLDYSNQSYVYLNIQNNNSNSIISNLNLIFIIIIIIITIINK